MTRLSQSIFKQKHEQRMSVLQRSSRLRKSGASPAIASSKKILGTLFVLTCLSWQTCSAVSASPDNDSLIVPGVSLGKIALGMDREKVHTLLKAPLKADQTCDQYWSRGRKNFVFIWYTPERKVNEIMFSSPTFRTANGITTKKYDDKIKQFYPGRLRWRFLNLRYLLKTGGFAIYVLNADCPSENPDYHYWTVGAVYKGKTPAVPLLVTDHPGKSGWQTWDGVGEHLYDDLGEQPPGTVGIDLDLQ